LRAGQPLLFADQTFDLILCDWVLEHVQDPEPFVSEIQRVLKIGGWFCARTPNRWSYYAAGARILRGPIGEKVLRKLQPYRRNDDTFPTCYRLNTLREIAREFKPGRWINASYIHNENATYHGNMPWFCHLISWYQKFMPRSRGSVIMIFVRRVA
jgi:ubiquinone/menaquinone biosynthesis C-methylase UbiE